MPRQIWTPGWGGRGFRQIAASFYLTKLRGRLNEYLPSHSEDNGFESALWYRLNWQWPCTTSLSPDQQTRLGIKLEHVMPGSRREADENWARLGYYVASSGNFLPKVSGQPIGPIFNGRESFKFIIHSKLQALTMWR